jgi:hypothetical protein
MNTTKALEWTLRLGVFGEFLGHGILAIGGKASWIGWIEQLLGVDTATATTLLLWIGAMDVAVAVMVLFWRRVPRAVLLWAAVWGFWTALLRPIVGESIWDFVERWANWATPLALLFVYGWPKKSQEWWR